MELNSNVNMEDIRDLEETIKQKQTELRKLQEMLNLSKQIAIHNSTCEVRSNVVFVVARRSLFRTLYVHINIQIKNVVQLRRLML